MKIGNIEIGLNEKPFTIAEMSGNHNKSIERAFDIVDAAAKSGASALKLQTYKPETITLDISDREFMVNHDNSSWNGKSLYKLYDEAYTPWEWHKPIIERANKNGMICFSSPFDETAIDFLEDLNVPAYKIASFENIHLPLIKKAAMTGKPLIISTGMASISEIHEAVEAARENGCKNLILLKCTSTYPALPINSNILTIPHMRKLFNCEIGLSDHTMGVGVAVAAVTLGATVIEKHLTLRRSEGGVDSAFSLEPDEFKSLVIESERAWQCLGDIKYGPTNSEKDSVVFRRSLYVSKDIKKGEKFTDENIKCVRPGLGLKPKHYESILGKKANIDLSKGTPLTWNQISNS